MRATEFELASGSGFGEHADAGVLTEDGGSTTPAGALKAAVVTALAEGLCLVSFSGGLDSSLVLAAATHAARERSLPDPVPVSVRFQRFPPADESRWQERVIRHLHLADWQRNEAGDELDTIGPVATQVLRRHGVLYPANTFFHSPLLEQGRGGTLLTGFGGDDVFTNWSAQRTVDVLLRRERPELADLFRLAQIAGPRRVRRRVLRARLRRYSPPWLRPQARSEFLERWISEELSEPRRWDRRVAWLARQRYVAVTRHSLDLIASDAGAKIEHPLLAPRFLAAVASAGGRTGWGDRSRALRALFAHLLPADVLARRDKARTGGALSRSYTRAFAENWQGGTFDPELVDEDALRYEWFKLEPGFGALHLLQAAWLASEAQDRPVVAAEAASQ